MPQLPRAPKSSTPSRVHLTRHARNRIRRRRPFVITEEDVKAVLQEPEADEADEDEARNAWGRIRRNWWLRVTYSRERHGVVVLTVVARKRGPKGTR